jgi:hypothetical protein
MEIRLGGSPETRNITLTLREMTMPVNAAFAYFLVLASQWWG